jgi:hypothetical protein
MPTPISRDRILLSTETVSRWFEAYIQHCRTYNQPYPITPPLPDDEALLHANGTLTLQYHPPGFPVIKVDVPIGHWRRKAST